MTTDRRLVGRIRWMCQRMGWRDEAISRRVGLPAAEVLAIRRRHGVVHYSETPEAAELQRLRRERDNRRKREQRAAARGDWLAEEPEVVIPAADPWAAALAGRRYQDMPEWQLAAEIGGWLPPRSPALWASQSSMATL